MTSLRKVKDFTKIAAKSRPSRPHASVYAEEIEAILGLEPPEGLLIPLPNGVSEKVFRRRIKAMVTGTIEPVSPHRYRVSVAVTGEILVGCHV